MAIHQFVSSFSAAFDVSSPFPNIIFYYTRKWPRCFRLRRRDDDDDDDDNDDDGKFLFGFLFVLFVSHTHRHWKKKKKSSAARTNHSSHCETFDSIPPPR